MVAQLVLPLLAALALWFAGTGLIAWACNRPRATFGRSLLVGGLAAAAGLVAIVVAARHDTALAAYAAAAGALAVWGWHELAFLTGAVSGPRRSECPPGARGWARFRAATETLIAHEIALALTALFLASLCWDAPNPVGAQLFALLFGLRLTSKLNIFAGAPNFSDEMLPPHLAYLKSYFGRPRLRPALLLSIAAIALGALWLATRALATPAGSAEATGMGLLFGLSLLGLLEHLFLALPLRDGALWRWAMPARPH